MCVALLMFEFENGWKPLERSLRPTRCQTSKLPISKLDPYHHFFIKLFWRRFSWSQFFGYLYLGTILWIFLLSYFCGSYFFGYLYLGIFVGHKSLDICIWVFLRVIFFGYLWFGIFAGHIYKSSSVGIKFSSVPLPTSWQALVNCETLNCQSKSF